jgi:hypothetical protein
MLLLFVSPTKLPRGSHSLAQSSQHRGRSQHCGSHASTHAESFEQDGFYFACVCVCVCLCVCVDDLTDLSKVTQHNRFVTKFVSESRGKEMSGERSNKDLAD